MSSTWGPVTSQFWQMFHNQRTSIQESIQKVPYFSLALWLKAVQSWHLLKIFKEIFIASNKHADLIVTTMYNSGSAELLIKVKSASVRLELLHHLFNILVRNEALIGGEPAQGITLHNVLSSEIIQRIVQTFFCCHTSWGAIPHLHSDTETEEADLLYPGKESGFSPWMQYAKPWLF